MTLPTIFRSLRMSPSVRKHLCVPNIRDTQVGRSAWLKPERQQFETDGHLLVHAQCAKPGSKRLETKVPVVYPENTADQQSFVGATDACWKRDAAGSASSPRPDRARRRSSCPTTAVARRHVRSSAIVRSHRLETQVPVGCNHGLTGSDRRESVELRTGGRTSQPRYVLVA